MSFEVDTNTFKTRDETRRAVSEEINRQRFQRMQQRRYREAFRNRDYATAGQIASQLTQTGVKDVAGTSSIPDAGIVRDQATATVLNRRKLQLQMNEQEKAQQAAQPDQGLTKEQAEAKNRSAVRTAWGTGAQASADAIQTGANENRTAVQTAWGTGATPQNTTTPQHAPGSLVTGGTPAPSPTAAQSPATQQAQPQAQQTPTQANVQTARYALTTPTTPSISPQESPAKVAASPNTPSQIPQSPPVPKSTWEENSARRQRENASLAEQDRYNLQLEQEQIRKDEELQRAADEAGIKGKAKEFAIARAKDEEDSMRQAREIMATIPFMRKGGIFTPEGHFDAIEAARALNVHAVKIGNAFMQGIGDTVDNLSSEIIRKGDPLQQDFAQAIKTREQMASITSILSAGESDKEDMTKQLAGMIQNAKDAQEPKPGQPDRRGPKMTPQERADFEKRYSETPLNEPQIVGNGNPLTVTKDVSGKSVGGLFSIPGTQVTTQGELLQELQKQEIRRKNSGNISSRDFFENILDRRSKQKK